ncbi:MAG: hypothetical protein ACKV2U_09715 [Bryobacteraceae bacterium]
MIKKLIQKIRGLVALLAVSMTALNAATIGASEPMAWRFAHPEAQILAGVDFRKLAETPDGKQIRDQFVAALGAPILDQAERLLMSSVVEATGRRSDVLILSGSFTLPQLRKMAMSEGAQMTPYKGLEIAAPAGAVAGDPHLAWITGPGGGTTVLIGTRPAIQAAAERSKAHVESMASVNRLFARARDLAQYPVWVSCETIPQGFGPKEIDSFIENGDAFDVGRLEGFDVGIQVGKPAGLNMWIWTATEATADVVLKQFQAGAAGKDRFALSSWLPELKGSIENSTLVLGAPLAAGAVAERLGPLMAAFGLPVDVKAKAPPPPPPPPVSPAAPPKKMFVRIEGMDDGLKDIPYTAKQ